MMAFPANGFVLLAMPKCASTSIEGALAPYASLVIDKPPSRKHLGCAGFTKRIAPELAADGHSRESYELVSMFRDPIAWLESWWRYRARLDVGSANSTQGMTFERFARSYVDADPTGPAPRGRPGLFVTIDGVVEVDRIFAIDRPDVWEAWFGARLGVEVSVGRRNVSEERVSAEISDAMHAELVDYFAPEYSVQSRLAETGEWAGARGTPLAVPTRPRQARQLHDGHAQNS